jgi:nitrate reductase gamma subunit
MLRYVRKGFTWGFYFSILGHIILVLAGWQSFEEAALNTLFSGIFIWGPIGAVSGFLIGVTFILLRRR